MNQLEAARERIEKADREMAELFTRRMEAVKEIAVYKKENGLQIEDAGREEELIKRGCALVSEDIRAYYVSFLRSGMDISKRYQHRLLDGMSVAYSGVAGAFAEIAAKRIFPDGSYTGFADFRSAYEAAVSGECDCAVLPVENSFAGDVGQVMDLAFFGRLFISGMYDIGIVQNLLAVRGAKLHGIREVTSHPQALAQCADYIKKRGFTAVPADNTAAAAKAVAESGRTDIAAIGSEGTVALYGLEMLESHINDNGSNTTRFAVFTRSGEARMGDSRFILLFTVKNEAGSLSRAVSVIGRNGFNLRALKSRPTKELVWNYYFFAEGEGNICSERGEKMLSELRDCCTTVKIAGSYKEETKL